MEIRQHKAENAARTFVGVHSAKDAEQVSDVLRPDASRAWRGEGMHLRPPELRRTWRRKVW